MTSTKQHEIYMANASSSLWGPNATYITPARVRGWLGGNTILSVCIEGNANFTVVRYQHVGFPNAKVWHWGSQPTRGPNANGLVSQWNTGLTHNCPPPPPRLFFFFFFFLIRISCVRPYYSSLGILPKIIVATPSLILHNHL